MSYFSNFPMIVYNFDVGGVQKLITVRDIALNVRVQKEILQAITIYDEYDIEDGETPEIISEKLYGKPIYHWTIMLINNRFDYIKDWPMTSNELANYITLKYGEGNEYDQHTINGNLHFINKDGNVVSKLTEDQFNVFYPDGDYISYSYGFEEVNNTDYETQLNEDKRRIKVLNSNAVVKMTQDLQSLMNE